MDVITRVKEKLKKRPEVRFEEGEANLRVFPTDEHGFEVVLIVSATGITVGFDGWHEEFQDEDAALDCFAFGLSDSARLKVSSRGGYDYHWTLESRQGADWIPESTTGLLFFPFWRRKNVRLLQNGFLRNENPKDP